MIRVLLLPHAYGIHVVQIRITLPHLQIPVMAMPSKAMLQGLMLYEYKIPDIDLLEINSSLERSLPNNIL